MDFISWNNAPISKLKAWHIWSSLRVAAPVLPWNSAVWHKLQVCRYSHHCWLVCLGRISTKLRLSSFGLLVDTACCLCPGRIECVNHQSLHCPFSSFILQDLCIMLHITTDGFIHTCFIWFGQFTPRACLRAGVIPFLFYLYIYFISKKRRS